MEPFSRFNANGLSNLDILSEDGGLVLSRGWQEDAGGESRNVLIVFPVSEQPTPTSLDRIVQEYSFKDELDSKWAARPLELVRDRGRTILVLEDPGGESLGRLLGSPIEVGRCLRIAIGVAAALGKAHEHGLVHKDIKPANILVNAARDEVRLTGFGNASRLMRERQPPDPPEVIAGTLAYMAPEQTGRMNRSIDSRSDLYSFGVTLYEMLTGRLPFAASDPMEWVHCHIARLPSAPSERVSGIPEVLSSIVMKLLAKTAEQRYQTASGIEADLRHSLKEWQSHHRIDPFLLGAHDAPDRMLVPEKLYGREREIATLTASFDRVVGGGRPELVLVSGYSGIGKSSVVNELHKSLVPPRGLFASGKFDQYKRDIPYATLAQAFQTLVRQILVKSEAEVDHWRRSLLEALGPNGQLIVNLIPELEFVIGKQPPAAELAPREARARFQFVFLRFFGVFARPEHPLALFLDDLQWLDAASLDLLECLATHPDIRHVLLIGAYRDNEVTSSHPLMLTLAAVRDAGAKIQELVLAPLGIDDVERLTTDALHGGLDSTGPLALLVHQKTGGNPFFAIQLLTSLAEEGLLRFDRSAACWIWDLGRIRAKGYSSNVAHLMLGKLRRLSQRTQTALQQFACLGNVAEIALLSVALGLSSDEIHAVLSEATRAGLIVRLEQSYTFLHDRIQEAAYALIPERECAGVHLRIGRLLLANLTADTLAEHLFDVAGQLNSGAKMLVDDDEKAQAAEINLQAGRKAKVSAAYASALKYFITGVELLGDHGRASRRNLIFQLELERAGCEFLIGDLVAADRRLTALSNHTTYTVERASLACLHIDVCTTLDQSDRAIAVALKYLRHVGIDWSPHPTEQEARLEYERTWSLLRNREIEELIDLPVMSDPKYVATLDVLERCLKTALYTDANLLTLLICRMVNISLEHGHTGASCDGYIWLGMIAGSKFTDYKGGFRFGRLGYDLAERGGLELFKAHAYLSFAVLIVPWTKHVRIGEELIHRAFDAANAIGDLTTAASCGVDLFGNLLMRGGPLADVQRKAEQSLEFARNARFGLLTDISATQLALIRTLRGLTMVFGCLSDAQFDELEVECRLSNQEGHAIEACWYWVRKLQARFFAGDYAAAVAASLNAQRLLWTSPSFLETADAHFYGALARAGAFDSATEDARGEHFEALAAHHRQLAIWAENCPENFENRSALVAAEIARIEGRDADSLRLYEQAIRSAREHGFVQNEGVAFEVAARFYNARGSETSANVHLLHARHCYLRWGADGKVRQLDRLYPHLAASVGQPPAAVIGSPFQNLDVASVVKASQALSGEIMLPKLIERLMTIAIENAGADRGLLILRSGDEDLIQAEARTTGDQVDVTMSRQPIAGSTCPESVVRYVIRTHESVILDDASKPSLFSGDDYLRDRQSKSVLCLPLIKQRELTGVLLLENTLTSHAFAPAHVAVLELLAAQAAISLENTRLYSDLQEREAKVRRLFESNIIGILIGNPDDHVLEANQAFLRIVGYDQMDVASGRLRRTELTPPEWHDRDARAVAEMRATGTVQPFEKEYFRKDGSRVPVLVGGATLGERGDAVVVFALDLTERKRAEAELAHANRVTTMGQLTASIAHEVNQPLAAAITNAETAARWLAHQPPNLEKTRQSIDRIINDGKRAADIVSRIRDFSKKAPARKEGLEINEAILDVVGLTRATMSDHGVLAKMQLAKGLPPILGDTVQLQQVILNLNMNAIEAMSEVGEGSRELSISTSLAESGSVLIAIGDTGPGLPQAGPERIFEAFYTTKASGLGMGLSICRSIVEAHGGRLWATPNKPHGAVFYLMLPSKEKSLEKPEPPGVWSGENCE